MLSSDKVKSINFLKISHISLIKEIKKEHPDLSYSVCASIANSILEAFDQGVVRGRALSKMN